MHSAAPQAATVGTSQAEHVLVTHTPSRHSISVIPVVHLDDNHISQGVPPDGYEIGRVNYRDESNIWKPQGDETMYGGHVPQGNEYHVLTYPAGEVDAVRITARDMESLRPECWLRGNIIDFYIMYLDRHRLSSVYSAHVYFFNSFFFTKLVESSTQGNIGYEQVRRWTKDVNLFEKKYIFIPINQSSHWSLIIICNLASLSYEQISSTCILHLDSLKDRYLTHLVETYIRQYIIEAWTEKYQAGRDHRSSLLCPIMKFVQAEVPQQENEYDCGIYLLHYIERFLRELEVSSNLEIALMDPTLPTDQIPGIWFESSEVSMKRKEIENIIISLSQETSTCMGDKGAQFAATKRSQPHACTWLSRPKREKRKRNSNWADEETWILVKCKKEAAVEDGSRFCKGKPDVTNWDAIAEEINSNIATMPISKTGDQCRLRWDTLIKSYRRIKEHCRRSSKEFSELTRTERVELKLATTLSNVEWYEVIDQFCPPKPRKCKSRKSDIAVPNVDTLPWPPANPTHSKSPVQTGIRSFGAKEPSTKEAEVQDVYGESVAWNCAVGLPSHSQQSTLPQRKHEVGEQGSVEPCVEVRKLQLEGEIEELKKVNDSLMLELVQMRQQQEQTMEWKMQVDPGSSVLNGNLNPVGFGSPVPIPSADPEPRKSSRQQVSLSESLARCREDNHMAIPKFNSMSGDLRSTILNLVQAWPTCHNIIEMEEVCRWLAIVQGRSPLETRSYVFKLLRHNLLTISSASNKACVLKLSRLRVYKKFVKAVINKNLDYDIHKRMLELDISVLSFESAFVRQRIRVLTLFKCGNLERVDLGTLRMLRSLTIIGCGNLKAILGWENLGELGWLKMSECLSFHEHLKVHCLPSLKEFIVNNWHSSRKTDLLTRYTLDFSRCVRLRKMTIGDGMYTTKSVDLSTLKYLEELTFSRCDALESVVGLNELHALTAVTFSDCRALKTLPHLGHLNALAKFELNYSSVETISGFENLHSLTHLSIWNCDALKRLPDLGGLRALSYLCIGCRNVDEIPGLDSLHSLTRLELFHNEVLKRLPYLGHLKELKYLDISGSGVDEIPGVRELVNLVKLNCRNSQLEWLPDLGHLPRLEWVYLEGTPLIRVPSRKYFDKKALRFNEGVEWAELEVADVGESDYVPSDQEVYNKECR